MLHVNQLSVRSDSGVLVQPLSFGLGADEVLAVHGPSGAGKSIAMRALSGIVAPGLTVSGFVRLGDAPPVPAGRAQTGVVYLPQDPFSSLSPVHRVGQQIAWGMPRGSGSERSTRAARVQLTAQLLERVGLPEQTARAFPHELSGGMRQRAAVAAALAADPQVLIADEPTSALDSELRVEIIALIAGLANAGRSVIMVTHDTASLTGISSRVIEFDSGRARVRPYSQAPSASAQHPRSVGRFSNTTTSQTPVCVASDVSLTRGMTRILDSVSLRIHRGECVGVIGASGSGKTTLGRVLVGLDIPDNGSVQHFLPSQVPAGTHGEAVASAAERGTVTHSNVMRGKRATPQRRHTGNIQMVFQDCGGSLNPRHTVRRALREAATAPHHRTPEAAAELADFAGPLLDRLPHQLSGGQRQRAALARALVTRPDLLVCDEFTSAVDAAARDRLIAMLTRLIATQGLSVILISHDLASVAAICDRLVVLDEGKVVEQGAMSDLLTDPQHDRTRALVHAHHGQS